MSTSHWRKVALSEIAEVRLGRQRSPKRAVGPNMRPYMRAANVTWDGISLHDVKQMDFTPEEFETYALRRGDLLLSEASGSASEVGKPAVWNDEVPNCCFQNTLIRVRAPESLVPFLHLHFYKDALTGAFAKAARGVGIHHLGAKTLGDWQIHMPPAEEQRRIVETVQSYLSRLGAVTATLQRVRRKLKRYRASIVQAAVEGRLVPTEAELARAEGRDYEPAPVLLKRILAERQRRWEERDLARIGAAGKTPGTQGRKSKYREPVPPVAAALPPLPEGWCWASLDALAHIKGGITKGPQTWTTGQHYREVPYLRVANVQRGYLDLRDIKTITASEHTIDELRLAPGDVLFAEGGDRDKLGRGWVWRGERPECIYQNHVFRARIYTDDILPELLSWYANTSAQPYFFRGGKQTTNLASINLTTLRALPVPIAPLSEQHRIRDEIDQRLSSIDDAITSTRHQLTRCTVLMHLLLRRAFAGTLTANHSPTIQVPATSDN